MTDEDLSAYLGRVGVACEPVSLEALARLQTAHVRTFPFDNVDVLLGTHPGVDLSTVVAKFVGRGRGGYCFEHATLFGGVLGALGYAATPHLGRVGDSTRAGRTHLVQVVTLDGERYLCDVGIGRPPLGVLRLADGVRLDGPLERHRVVRATEGPGVAWELWRERPGRPGSEFVHVTDELPVRRVDVEMGHHFTSTSHRGRFLDSLVIARHGMADDGTPVHTTVSLDGVTERREAAATRHRPLDLDELPSLAERLGLWLTEAEVARLIARVEVLAAGIPRR